MDEALFNELIESCNEAIEHEKGNVKLPSHVITIPDEDISDKYNMLPDDMKLAITVIIDNALKAAGRAENQDRPAV